MPVDAQMLCFRREIDAGMKNEKSDTRDVQKTTENDTEISLMGGAPQILIVSMGTNMGGGYEMYT